MAKITATGKAFGIESVITVEKENDKLVLRVSTGDDEDYDKSFGKFLMVMLKDSIKHSKAIAGTYYPPENTLLAAWVGLNNDFFDDNNYKIDVEGELEPIPYEDGKIY